MNGVASSEGDAFALVMLCVLVCGMTIIGLIIFTIFRSASKRNHEVDDLIDDVSNHQKEQPKTPVASKKDAWEKDGDWWKKDE